MRIFLKLVAAIAAVYLLLLAGLFAAMHQPPGRFASIIAKTPGPVMMAMPFQRLWLTARAGSLQPGDTAPDFDLETVDKQSRVQLSSFRGQKPVVLVFGSYT